MDIKTRYYKFPVGSVVLRRTGDKLEKREKRASGRMLQTSFGDFIRETMILLRYLRKKPGKIRNSQIERN